MTNQRHVEPVTLEDGTRKYSNYYKYKPIPIEKRKYRIRKPDDPRAVRFRGDWLLPLELLEEKFRVMPETRPDTDAFVHMTKKRKCKCDPCQRPEAVKWQQWWRDIKAQAE
jgi:hypothetical protein